MPDLECKAKKRKRLAKRRDLYRKVGISPAIQRSLLGRYREQFANPKGLLPVCPSSVRNHGHLPGAGALVR